MTPVTTKPLDLVIRSPRPLTAALARCGRLVIMGAIQVGGTPPSIGIEAESASRLKPIVRSRASPLE
jgi:hypothetical protein